MDDERAEDEKAERERAEHRRHLVLAKQRSHEDYDKAVLALAGGGFGISLAFIKDIVGCRTDLPFCLLYWCWICWTVSIASTLVSLYTTGWAMDKAIAQHDAKTDATGGLADVFTKLLNTVSGVAFLVGVVLLVLFVAKSLGGK